MTREGREILAGMLCGGRGSATYNDQTKVMSRLIRDGYIRVERSRTGDKTRRNCYYLTDKGRDIAIKGVLKEKVEGRKRRINQLRAQPENRHAKWWTLRFNTDRYGYAVYGE